MNNGNILSYDEEKRITDAIKSSTDASKAEKIFELIDKLDNINSNYLIGKDIKEIGTLDLEKIHNELTDIDKLNKEFIENLRKESNIDNSFLLNVESLSNNLYEQDRERLVSINDEIKEKQNLISEKEKSKTQLENLLKLEDNAITSQEEVLNQYMKINGLDALKQEKESYQKEIDTLLQFDASSDEAIGREDKINDYKSKMEEIDAKLNGNDTINDLKAMLEKHHSNRDKIANDINQVDKDVDILKNGGRLPERYKTEKILNNNEAVFAGEKANKIREKAKQQYEESKKMAEIIKKQQEAMQKKIDELKEREKKLDEFETKLNEREKKLDGVDRKLNKSKKTIDEKIKNLKEWEEELDKREEELKKREQEITQKELDAQVINPIIDTDDNGESKEKDDGPSEPLPVADTHIRKIKNDPKVTWKTVASVAAGIGIGATVFFTGGALGVSIMTIGGTIAKKIINNQRKKLELNRLNGLDDTDITDVQEPRPGIRGAFDKFKKYIKSEEGLRDMSWLITSAIITGNALNIGSNLTAKVNASTTNPTQTVSQPTQVQPVQAQPAAQVQPVQTTIAPTEVQSSLPDIRIGESVEGFNVSYGHTTATNAFNGTNMTHLRGDIINGSKSVFGSARLINADGTLGEAINTAGKSISQICSETGLDPSRVVFDIQNTSGASQAWISYSELINGVDLSSTMGTIVK